jgi:hypothetical protein
LSDQILHYGFQMTRFQDHPVFASDDSFQAPLTASELNEVRKMLASERHRQSLANGSDFIDEPTGQINHARLAERIYRARRDRERIFNDDIFADPAWDLLLDLFVRSARNEQVSISSACHAASVPEATALRYLKALNEKNYVERISHPNDKRSTMLKMTQLGSNLMIEWLDHFRASR